MKKKDDPFFKTLILSPFRCTKNRHILIADILADDEESETDGYDCVPELNMDHGIRHLPNRKDDGLMAFQCSSPRRIISRWLSSLRRPKRRRRDVVPSQKRENEVYRTTGTNVGDESTHATCSTNRLNGQFARDSSSFNVGVACGLVYLIVASKNELAKMVELRNEMEMLLQNAKEGLESKSNANFNAKLSELNEINLASSTTDLQQASSSSSESQFSLQSGVVRDQIECAATGMDRLEAELEAELERLHLHLDLENDISNSKAVRDSSVCVSSFGEVIHSHEAEPADYNEMPCDYGVPALELERRLHEVLEARQEERIKELEVALEHAKRKLLEKEMEVSWWKEAATAAVVSQHVPEASSSVASQHDHERDFHLFR